MWLSSELLRPKSRRRLANAVANSSQQHCLVESCRGPISVPCICSASFPWLHNSSVLETKPPLLCASHADCTSPWVSHVELAPHLAQVPLEITLLHWVLEQVGKLDNFFYRSPSDPVLALHSIFWELWAEWGLPTQAILGALRILISLLCFSGAGTQGLPWNM